MKFKIGDKVIVNAKKEMLSDLEADLRSELADRSITGATYDRIWRAIRNKEPFFVKGIQADGAYELATSKRSDAWVVVYEDELKGAQ